MHGRTRPQRLQHPYRKNEASEPEPTIKDMHGNELAHKDTIHISASLKKH